MPANIIIPVWKGTPVIVECLDAVFAHSGDRLLEVICVDNASPDDAARLIAERFPQARLIAQPVNLGFAGGVNAGLRAASGDVSVLLNQDCIVQAGWLDALLDALTAHPEFGIVGCTLFNADGSINHAGAQLRKPIALGQHFIDRGGDQPRAVDYVTGAAMAIRRTTWDTLGPFDDGFYPAYYEEVDYCYRARQRGLEIGYVPAATALHLFTSREWQHDPLKSWATHQHSRYRFVCKHFDAVELTQFFELETAAIEAEPSFEMNAARVLGSRDTLRSLAEIAARRAADLADPLTVDQVRLLRVGFAQIARQAFAAIEQQARANEYMPPRWLESAPRLADDYLPPHWLENAPRLADDYVSPRWLENAPQWATPSEELAPLEQQLRSLQHREQEILAQAFFTTDSSALKRLGKRLLSLVTGREYRLLTELNVLQTHRLDVMTQQIEALQHSLAFQRQQFEQSLNQTCQQFEQSLSQTRQQFEQSLSQTHQQFEQSFSQTRQQFIQRLAPLDRRLALLETLMDYDYR